jgi:hypothetical protein
MHLETASLGCWSFCWCSGGRISVQDISESFTEIVEGRLGSILHFYAKIFKRLLAFLRIDGSFR